MNHQADDPGERPGQSPSSVPSHEPSLEGGPLASQRRFIALWGQMGSSWGIRRTMAEVHALLYISGRPMNTDELMEGLGISRGNASMALRSLEDWGIVFREHRRGDRKEYFSAEQDVWKLFRTVLRERKKRELDPLLEALCACRGESDEQSDDPVAIDAQNQRLDQLIEFVQMVDTISQRFISPSGSGLQKAAKLLAMAS